MKPTLALSVALLLAPLASLQSDEATRHAAPALSGQRMLFTGHSFHIPLIPFIEQIAKAAQINGHEVVARQMIGGSKVKQHPWQAVGVEPLAGLLPETATLKKP